MKRPPLTPLGAVGRGALAGAVGTLAMDVVWYARYRRDAGENGFVEWEFSTKPDWDEVSVPGQLGKRLVEGFVQRELDPKWAPLVNNVMHWGYGMLWGVQYGIRRDSDTVGWGWGAHVSKRSVRLADDAEDVLRRTASRPLRPSASWTDGSALDAQREQRREFVVNGEPREVIVDVWSDGKSMRYPLQTPAQTAFSMRRRIAAGAGPRSGRGVPPLSRPSRSCTRRPTQPGRAVKH